MKNLEMKKVIDNFDVLLSDAHIYLSRVEDSKAELLESALNNIQKILPDSKIKFIDHKFGNFRISFIEKVEIPKELRELKEVVFYS